MNKSRFPFHLRSYQSISLSACGNSDGVNLQWRSIKRVECKNCLKLIERNVETRYFKPQAQKEGE
jgi:hypothetical protein